MVLKITRKNILYDSIYEFKHSDIATNIMQIIYVDEEGRDLGGLIKDWITTVTNEIIKSKAFKIVPSGNYLTINESANVNILEFTGKIIAIAYNKKMNVNLKLASYVWKLLLNERITVEDMKEYDTGIYQSLKWILNNDVSEMNEVFVDQNDEELKKNGRNIELTNKNKNEYVKLMLKKYFIGKNENLFMILKKGFDETIDTEGIQAYNAIKLRRLINGIEKIDLDDWKENTKQLNNNYFEDEDYYEYNDNNDDNDYEYYIDLFFRAISNWPNEKLQKLLKFITGSSVVPIKGFKYLDGGLFTIKIIDDPNRFPEAHTCFNMLVLPCNNSKKQLEEKLLMAIEVVDFGLS